MIEDKLSPGQRIRLESVAQANLLLQQAPRFREAGDRGVVDELLAAAQRIASYIGFGPEPAE